MTTFDLLQANLLSPMLLAFALGVIARLVKSDLAFPKDLGTMLSIFLLFAIGLKGGAALGQASPGDLLLPALAALVLGIVIPLWTYPVVRRLGGFPSEEAAALVAHYGSTSAVTFLAALTFLESVGSKPEGYMPGLLAIMEVPGIVVALLLARPTAGERKPLGPAIWHVLTGKSLLLLIGGMAIGWLADPKGLEAVNAFFVDPFRGVLCLFLLELGMIAAERLRELKAHALFLIGFGIVAPVVNGCLGVVLGHHAGLSAAGATVLGVLAASASYIAAPAAVRMALPQVNPGPALASALGVTFPFNLIVGLPLYYELAVRL